MKRILVGTDFSTEADKALQTAAGWARAAGAALRVVHVVPPKRRLVGAWQTSSRTVSAIQSRAMTVLKERADALDPERRLELSTGVVSGAASAELLRSARDFEADLLVVGTRGEHEVSSRHAALGGTAMKLLAAAPVPLLLVRTAAYDLPASVLAAVDLSPVSPDVLSAACASVRPDGDLVVFHAYEAPFVDRLDAYGVSGSAIDIYMEGEQQRHARELEALAASSLGTAAADTAGARDEATAARASGPELGGARAESGTACSARVQVVVERGNPIEPLFRQIELLHADLVVLGRGRSAGRRSARGPGSVSRHVALFSPANVLVAPISAGKSLSAE
jgi:nucleotide-binding universal stress UspA family protein